MRWLRRPRLQLPLEFEMSAPLVRDLEILAELFRSGGWRELRVESGGVSVLFSTDLAAVSLSGPDGTAERVPASVEAAAPAAHVAAPAPRGPAASSAVAPEPGWHAVRAPNLGTFYRSPKPGAAPFVEVGQRVTADAEICLLEVMKLFTSVKAGVAGTVAQIAAADAELVEGGQVLFYIDSD